MARKPSIKTKIPTAAKKTGGANSIGATTQLHEGAQYYYRRIRTSEVLGNHFRDPKNLITDFSRWNLVNKSRYFVENIPAVKGAIEEISTYAVGNGYIPTFCGVDSKWGNEAEAWLQSWYQICDPFGYSMAMDLFLASCAIDRDGDVGVHLSYANDGKYPRVYLVPTHRITTADKVIQDGPFKGYRVFDGVIVDESSRPLGYNVKLTDSGSGNSDIGSPADQGACVQVSTTDMLLLFEPKFPMQLRGYPSMTAAINDWQDYRDIKDFEREAIKQAASIALIEKNPVGGVLPGQYQFGLTSSYAQDGNPQQPVYWKYYNGGQVRYFGSNDPNANIEQMANNRPGQDTQAFVNDHILRGAFNSLGIPIEICHNMGGMNSANTRAILSKLQRKIGMRQATMMKMARRVSLYAIAKAIKLGLLPSNKEWYKWSFVPPPSPSIDLGREAKADIDYYKIGANTLSDIFGSNGEQWEDKLRQWVKEKVRLKEIVTEEGGDPNDPIFQQILVPNQTPQQGGQPNEAEQPTGKTK